MRCNGLFQAWDNQLAPSGRVWRFGWAVHWHCTRILLLRKKSVLAAMTNNARKSLLQLLWNSFGRDKPALAVGRQRKKITLISPSQKKDCTSTRTFMSVFPRYTPPPPPPPSKTRLRIPWYNFCEKCRKDTEETEEIRAQTYGDSAKTHAPPRC